MKIRSNYEQVDYMYGPRKKVIDMIHEPHWMPEMIETESAFLCGLIREYKPRKILEVGVAAGGTTAIILECIEELGLQCKMISVDYSVQFYRDKSKKTGYIASELKDEIGAEGTQLDHTFYLGGTVASFLPEIGNEIDLVVLDTMHIIPGELLDFLAVYPYLSNNAIVCLHDISLNQTTEDRNIATNVLYNAVVADKILNLLPDANRYGVRYPNIGAFRINEDTAKYIGNVFGMLTLNWAYQLEQMDLDAYRNTITAYYDEELVDILENAVIFNKPRERYLFPYEIINEGSRIIMYGAGNVGKAYYKQIQDRNWCELVKWVDSNYEKYTDTQYPVSSPEGIEGEEYDYILIAIWTDDNAMAIKAEMINRGIPDNKIIWVK